ncbi:unnamed protein product [Dicrocoelium dendriticum]|nr:unnamed protein product [Dicrocoelium dendriticum]
MLPRDKLSLEQDVPELTASFQRSACEILQPGPTALHDQTPECHPVHATGPAVRVQGTSSFHPDWLRLMFRLPKNDIGHFNTLPFQRLHPSHLALHTNEHLVGRQDPRQDIDWPCNAFPESDTHVQLLNSRSSSIRQLYNLFTAAQELFSSRMANTFGTAQSSTVNLQRPVLLSQPTGTVRYQRTSTPVTNGSVLPKSPIHSRALESQNVVGSNAEFVSSSETTAAVFEGSVSPGATGGARKSNKPKNCIPLLQTLKREAGKYYSEDCTKITNGHKRKWGLNIKPASDRVEEMAGWSADKRLPEGGICYPVSRLLEEYPSTTTPVPDPIDLRTGRSFSAGVAEQPNAYLSPRRDRLSQKRFDLLTRPSGWFPDKFVRRCVLPTTSISVSTSHMMHHGAISPEKPAVIENTNTLLSTDVVTGVTEVTDSRGPSPEEDTSAFHTSANTKRRRRHRDKSSNQHPNRDSDDNENSPRKLRSSSWIYSIARLKGCDIDENTVGEKAFPEVPEISYPHHPPASLHDTEACESECRVMSLPADRSATDGKYVQSSLHSVMNKRNRTTFSDKQVWFSNRRARWRKQFHIVQDNESPGCSSGCTSVLCRSDDVLSDPLRKQSKMPTVTTACQSVQDERLPTYDSQWSLVVPNLPSYDLLSRSCTAQVPPSFSGYLLGRSEEVGFQRPGCDDLSHSALRKDEAYFLAPGSRCASYSRGQKANLEPFGLHHPLRFASSTTPIPDESSLPPHYPPQEGTSASDNLDLSFLHSHSKFPLLTRPISGDRFRTQAERYAVTWALGYRAGNAF